MTVEVSSIPRGAGSITQVGVQDAVQITFQGLGVHDGQVTLPGDEVGR